MRRMILVAMAALAVAAIDSKVAEGGCHKGKFLSRVFIGRVAVMGGAFPRVADTVKAVTQSVPRPVATVGQSCVNGKCVVK